jgi:5-methylcytosine-specific restriction endonuclease McrA
MSKYKTCIDCNQTLSLDSFYKRANSKDGKDMRCKECRKASTKADYQKHAEKRKNAARLRTATNPQYSIEYRKRTREHRLQYNREWYQNNKEYAAQYQYGYRYVNREQARNLVARRRTRRQENGVYHILPKELKRLYASPCFYCGSKTSIHADHIIPISKGGRHSIGNLVPACSSCNLSKNDKFLTIWKYRGAYAYFGI